MRYILIAVIAGLLLTSCVSHDRNYNPVSNRIETEAVEVFNEFRTWNGQVKQGSSDQKLEALKNNTLPELMPHNFKDCELQWTSLKPKVGSFDQNERRDWFTVTGRLLEYSGANIYAAELQKLSCEGLTDSAPINVKMLKPYIFTMNADHVYWNILASARLEYEHSLGGEVSLVTDTQALHSGKITMNFSLTTRRYIELNIRIPEWAKNATVTVKQVKYFVKPGDYCKVAKKWKEGDVVEIEFAKPTLPDYLL